LENPIIVWFRSDLRVADNPALTRAAKTGKPIIPLYILETDCKKPWGAASQWWLHYSLIELTSDLGELVLRKGKAKDILATIIKETGADHIVWNRRYEKDRIDIDTDIKSSLADDSLMVESFKANLLNEPWEVKTKTNGYYKVFTPYWRAARDGFQPDNPLQVPKSPNFYKDIQSDNLDDWCLLPSKPDWGAKIKPFWSPGSKGAHERVKHFLSGPVDDYTDDRNRPDKEGTSRLSPHLAFGEISPREIWHACEEQEAAAEKFLSEVGWREFSYNLLYYNPDLATESFRPDFNAFPWEKNDHALECWQQGQTGYPFVDAGMRQLWQTGWQHNRVRMVTASFLIKHLLIDWREGEKWFWDTLVDADPANNTASWQWVAGSGADAAPYFRIFNPFTQGEKFDRTGDYVRKFVPELKDLPEKYLNRPWEAPEDVLEEAGVVLGKTYPKPIVDHKLARERALAAYKETKGE